MSSIYSAFRGLYDVDGTFEARTLRFRRGGSLGHPYLIYCRSTFEHWRRFPHGPTFMVEVVKRGTRFFPNCSGDEKERRGRQEIDTPLSHLTDSLPIPWSRSLAIVCAVFWVDFVFYLPFTHFSSSLLSAFSSLFYFVINLSILVGNGNSCSCSDFLAFSTSVFACCVFAQSTRIVLLSLSFACLLPSSVLLQRSFRSAYCVGTSVL